MFSGEFIINESIFESNKVLYVKCHQNQYNRFVKTVNTKIKLHKFANFNLNLEKSLVSDMHFPTPAI